MPHRRESTGKRRYKKNSSPLTIRSIAILGGAIVEDCFTAYIRSETIAGKIADNLFANVIDSFGHKINAAYVFALIDEDVWRELNLIRKIRNEFAHRIFADVENDRAVPEVERLTFKTRRIKDWCASLQYPNWSSTLISDPKERFGLSVVALSLDLHSAHQIVPLNRIPPPGFMKQLGKWFKLSK